MKNFLLPWLNVEKSPLGTLPNNPLNKLEQSSSFNTPDGGFLQNKAPMTPTPRMSVNPNAQKYKSELPMTKIPQSSNTSRQNFSAPMSIAPKMSIVPQDSIPFELPSFTDFQNQNFIPDPLKSFTPTYDKPKLEIPSEQSKINEKNKVISNDYNTKRNAMYAFMADVQKNDGGMTREMIEEHYPEFADNIESALQLQAEIAPIVSKGEAVKLSEIQKYYPELLSEPKFLKQSEVKKKDNEAKEYLKKISKVDQSVLSDEGKKWWGLMQGMQDLATQVRAQYQVPKDITDTEITNYVISNNPELKKRYKDGINAKLTDYDKAQLKLGGNWMSRISATAQNLTHRANIWLSENVIEPYMQASEEFKETNPNLSAINAPVKALLQIPGGLLHGTDKALSSMQRLANADYQSAGEIVGDGIKGLGGAGEIAFNTALAPLTAKFHTLGGTKAGKAVLDNTFGLLEEGLENIFQAPGVSKLYNALDEEARADLKNGVIIGLLHKGNKATENTRFNAKMAIKTATDAFNNAIQKGINSGRFQIWVEKGLAHENGRFQDGALGRIVKEGVSEFQSALTENIGKFSDVLKTRRQQVNTLTDQRGFVETTKSEIKEGVESVKKGAKNVGSVIKAETENLVGGIKKKINDLNTKSPVKQQGEIKEGSAGSEGKINDKDFTQKFSNFNRKFLQNQNRIDPSKIVEFEKRTGKKYGDYMLERGRVGGPEENVGKMTEYINTLKEQKRQAFEKMSGTAQSEAIGTLLTDIVERATQVRDPQSGKFTTMLTKHNEGGISFSELEEAKRRYEKNIKTGYYKDNNSVGIQRATNLDTEIRQYQQQEAIKQGFANIKELNKEISNAYFLSDNILKKQLKMDANNQVSLTDYLLLGAMPDNATGFAGLALKIAMKNKSVKNTMLHAVARLFGNHKNSKEIKVDLEKIEKMADQKSVADAIERFMKKWEIEEPKALPRFPQPTVIGKNGPQVKNPLSPQPRRRSVIEFDKRPKNVIESTKIVKKTGEKDELPSNKGKRSGGNVSISTPNNQSISKKNKIARDNGFDVDNDGNPFYEKENGEKITYTKEGRRNRDYIRDGFTHSYQFPLKSEYKKYVKELEKVRAGLIDYTTLTKLPGSLFMDGVPKDLILDTKIYEKNFKKHGIIDAANLLTTANEYDYAIRLDDGAHFNLLKKIPNSDKYLLIGADLNKNGDGKNMYTLTFYEPTNSLQEALNKSLANNREVFKRDNSVIGGFLTKTNNFKLLREGELEQQKLDNKKQSNIIGVKALPLKEGSDGKQQIVGGIKQRVGQANGGWEAGNRSLMEKDQKVIQTGNPGGGDEILRGSTDNSQSLGDGSQTSSKTRGQLREINTKVKEILNDHNFSIDRNSYSQEELETLAQYEGAGGLTNKGEDTTGVLDQFYTPDSVIQAMWRMVKPFKQDSILEPSVGVGRFLKYAPKNSKITAFDIDKTAGTIAQLLYPNAKVNIGEKLGDFQNQFMDFAGNPTFYRGERYDLVIGNPPYKERNTPQRVKGEEKKINRFEEYFIKKGVSVLNDGGHLIMIVPSSFLDKGPTAVKEWLNTHAELIDAYRLPEGIFDNTQVGTDIVLFEKKVPREQLLENGAYFEKHPEKILGTVETRVNRFGKEEQYIKGDSGALEKIGEGKIEPVKQNEPKNIIGIKEKKTVATKPAKKQVVGGVKKGVSKKRVLRGNKSDITDYNSGEEKIAYYQNLTNADGFVNAEVEDNPRLLNYINGGVQTNDLYFAGDIYEKLKQLELDKKSMTEEQYEKQKQGLEKILPTPLTIDQISRSPLDTDLMTTKTSELIEKYDWEKKGYVETNATIRDLFDKSLDNMSFRGIGASRRDIKTYLDGGRLLKETKAAVERVLNDFFNKFMKTELPKDTQKILVDKYNKTYRSQVKPDYAKMPLNTKGLSKSFKNEPLKLRETQIEGINAMLSKGTMLIAHGVGHGKTMEGVVATITAQQRGWNKRPLFVVPGPTKADWIETIKELYPKIEIVDLGGLTTKDIKELNSELGDNTRNWIKDGQVAIITHDGFNNKIDFTDATKEWLVSELNDTIAEEKESVSQMERRREKSRAIVGGIASSNKVNGDFSMLDNDFLMNQYSILTKTNEKSDFVDIFIKNAKDEGINLTEEVLTAKAIAFWGTKPIFIEDLGIDHLTVDEIHNYKNIFEKAKLEKSEGVNRYGDIQGSSSKAGRKMYLASQYILENNGGRNVFALSATPFNNQAIEVYNILSLLARNRLYELGIKNINDFYNLFADFKEDLVATPSGDDFKFQKVMKGFKNVGELQRLLNEYADYKTDSPDLVKPEKKLKKVVLEMSDLQKEIQAKLEERINKNEQEGDTLGGMVQMRLNLISPYITKDYAGSIPSPKEFLENSPKLKFSADTIKELRGMGKKDGVFIYMPLGTNYHGLLKEAIENHVGKEKVKIGIINGTTTKENKIKIAEQFRKGEIDVLIGGSNTSEGINLQDNGYITINTLLGRNPTERTQLNGRIWRQGNLRNEVLEVLPLLKDSGDIVMFQKAEEKSSRIIDIWSFQGEAFDLEEINPMEEKLALFTNPNRKAKVEIKIEERKIDKELNSLSQEVELYDRIVSKMRNEEIENYEKQIEKYKSEGYSEDDYLIKRTRDSIKAINKDIKRAEEKLERTKYDNVEELKEAIETLNKRIKELEEEKSNLEKTEDERTKKFEEEKNKNDKLEKSYNDYLNDLKKDFESLEVYKDRASQKLELEEKRNILIGFMNKKAD